RVRRNLQEIAYGGLLGTLQVADEFRYRMPLAVGVAEYRSSLAAACPQAAGLVLMDGPDLVLEDGGHRAGGMLRAHEVAAVGMAHEQAVAVAQPQVAGAILHHGEIARRSFAAGIHVTNRVRAQVEVIQTLLGG